MITDFEDHQPQIGKDVFIADSALVLGRVALADRSSIWYGSILRGDVHEISIGEATNIQDRCVIHVTNGRYATHIGSQVTVGHGAVLHGCTIADQVLVGIGAIVLDNTTVGQGSVIGAGSLLPPGKTYPGGSLIVGSPAKVKRPLSEDELAWIKKSADHYVVLAAKHAALQS
jgi:carbonic anhydrase/acetyltransferase-like protein (isoleucine patch superfamily)